mmetsp:Transcript_35622/g.92533  ORF Transcript_35622/g.92533 Transcript_35622/m.92533 type:complete len:212 (+) Transcript_35622:142-777(+)
MTKETARHKLAQERARGKEHHARCMAQKAATRAQEKARAEMEKRRAAAAAKGDKAARQAERKRAEAAARRAVDAAKTPAKDKALLEKEDEKLRQAAQKEARATDAITEQQVVLDGLQASMALATEHTQNTTEVRSALYMDCCLALLQKIEAARASREPPPPESGPQPLQQPAMSSPYASSRETELTPPSLPLPQREYTPTRVKPLGCAPVL